MDLRRRDPSPARGRSRGTAARIALACVLPCVLASACTLEPGDVEAPATETEAETEPVIDRVVRRLSPAAFENVPTPRHGPVVQIGDEARPVVRAPEEVLVGEAFGVVPEGGRAQVELTLPPEVAALPTAAFVLNVQELPFTAPLADDVMAKIARENFSLRRDTGWSLQREDAGPRAVLVLDHDGDAAVQLNLHLSAQLPVPTSLESKSFDVPPGARLALGFGLSGTRDDAATGIVAFVAHLACDGSEAREVFRREVSGSNDAPIGWHDAVVELPAPAADCRLRLANDATAESNARAVWAVPQILAPSLRVDTDTNLILISLDTLRSDHLSGLGYPRHTSPIIDAELIAKGTTFADTVSTFPQTDVSHLSLFTGLYPSAQPKRGRVSPSDRLVMLAERLQDAGMETAAYTENALVSGAFGFWFGFDQFTERSFAHADRGRPTFEDGIRFVQSHRDRRFFLFLHTYKTHDPYVPGPDYDALWSEPEAWRDGGPAPWIPEKYREILDRYDQTIREADDLVGGLLSVLDRLDLTGRTLVVVTSDHGEAFGEHGLSGHGFTPHGEALNVPLIFRGPGIPAGARVDTPVSIVDLTPTLLELLHLEPAVQSQGVSLVPAFEGGELEADRPLFFSWLRPEAQGVRRNTLKYHRTTNGHEQFDLATDPNEWKADRGDAARVEGERVLAAHEAEASRLRRELGPADPVEAAPGVRAIDKRLERSLEALGYLD